MRNRRYHTIQSIIGPYDPSAVDVIMQLIPLLQNIMRIEMTCQQRSSLAVVRAAVEESIGWFSRLSKSSHISRAFPPKMTSSVPQLCV